MTRICAKSILSRRNSKCKGPEAETVLECWDQEKISVPGIW